MVSIWSNSIWRFSFLRMLMERRLLVQKRWRFRFPSSPPLHHSAGRHLNSCSSLDFSKCFTAFTFVVEILKAILLNSGKKDWLANSGQEGVTWPMLSLSGWSSKLALLHSLGLTNAFLHTVSPLTQGCLDRGAQLALFYHALTDEIQTVSSDCEQAACWPTATVMRPLAKYQKSGQS